MVENYRQLALYEAVGDSKYKMKRSVVLKVQVKILYELSWDAVESLSLGDDLRVIYGFVEYCVRG